MKNSHCSIYYLVIRKCQSVTLLIFVNDMLMHCMQTAILLWQIHPSLRPAHSGIVYRVGQSILPCVSCQSDLGVSYNNKLEFSPHINNIVTKASLHAKLILKCFQSRDHLLLTKAFCVFVRPLLEYCCVIWNPMC